MKRTTATVSIACLMSLPLFASSSRHGVRGRKPAPPPSLDMEKVKHAVSRLTLEEATREEERAIATNKLVLRTGRRDPADAGRRRYMAGGLGDHARTGWGRPEFWQHD